MSVFDVTGADIVQLSDDVLAELLGRLAEAEAAANGIPLSAVTYGGHGNAPDGGIDARVSWSAGPERTDFFPRRTTAFQSKTKSMSAKKIMDEMAPGGQPRPVLHDLAREGGAYIMFCGRDNCTDSRRRERLAAMRSAVSGVKESRRLALNFYDASHIARWCNMRKGVAAWLRDKLGRPLRGWRPYEPWSRPDARDRLPYLTDGTSRASFTLAAGAAEVGVAEALARVRSMLTEAGRSVRLVGLSGTGKTRFAEALFDDSVGEAALPTSLVIYGDVGAVDASPVSVAQLLIADGCPAIVIADNCPAGVHRQVTNVISRPNSRIAFLSIDYDVGEDQPDATQVVRLREDSNEVIARLLLQRAPNLGLADRDRIVEFSGGNSRIALVLVRAAQEGGSLANLTDRDLVRRLFQDDRQPANDTLIRCAEAASLVVSYSVEPDGDGANPEYHHLAYLADVSPQDMHRATREFLNRGVAQQRGPWRAMLPQALAARLARQALESISRAELLKAFTERASRRLGLSFAKRLGQLDDHPKAQALARMLLAADGPIGVVLAGDDYGLGMLRALAPAAQEAALDMVERSLDADEAGLLVADGSQERFWIASLVMQMAYEPALFDRATMLLVRTVKDETENNNVNRVRDFFEQLFWVVMSGTRADPDQRIDFAEDLLDSNVENIRQLGIAALDAALKAGNFSSTIDLTKFGGRARSWGWHPRTDEEAEQVFARSMRRLTAIAISDDPLADRARSVLADRVPELSRKPFIHLVEEAARAVRARGFWPAGWREVCTVLHFDRQSMDEETRSRIAELEKVLAPQTLNERFETFVLQPYWELWTPYPEHENDRHIDIGPELDMISRELKDAPEQVRAYALRATRCPQGQAAEFGASLVAAGFDADCLYSIGIQAWDVSGPRSRHVGFMLGVLKRVAEEDTDKAEEMLDRVADHQSLARDLVSLSRVIRPPSSRSLARILCALRSGRLEASSLLGLANGVSHRQLPQEELVETLSELAGRGREGNAAAANILFSLQHQEENAIGALAPELRALAKRTVKSEHFFSSTEIMRSYMANSLARAVLDDEDDPALASTVLANMRAVIEAGARGDNYHRDLLCFIARRYADIFLTDVVLNDRKEGIWWHFFIRSNDDDFRDSVNPIDCLDADLLIRWVRRDPVPRARRVAQLLTFAKGSGESAGDMAWTPAALDLIGIEVTAPDVLREFEKRFYLGGWSGSEAHRYIRRRSLCVALRDHSNPVVSRWSREALRRLERAIKKAEEEERRGNQSFE